MKKMARFFGGSNAAMRKLNNSAVGEMEITDRATRKGVAVKTLLYAGVTVIGAFTTFLIMLYMLNSPSVTASTFSTALIALIIGSAIIAVISGIVATVNVNATMVAGFIYAFFEGILVGLLSILGELFYPGIIFAALAATLLVFLSMAVLYYTGIIKVGHGFRSFMISALIGIVLFNIVVFLLSLFIPALGTLFYGNGILSIAISVVMVAFCALMLLLDFNTIDRIVEQGLEKKYEWLGAFGLLLTIIWMYLEIFKLLMKLASRSK